MTGTVLLRAMWKHMAMCSFSNMVTALLVLLALPAAASAQVDPDSIIRRNDCRLAAQILTHGEPANKRSWAIWRITVCGTSGAEVLASLINSHRGEEEFSAALDSLITAGRRLVEPVLFETALDIASDGSAGRSARVQAIRLLYAMLNPGNLTSYESLLTNGGRIDIYIDSHMKYLPARMAAVERAEAALSRIIAAENTPEDVLAAADKVRFQLWHELECPLEVGPDECLERLDARRARAPSTTLLGHNRR